DSRIESGHCADRVAVRLSLRPRSDQPTRSRCAFYRAHSELLHRARFNVVGPHSSSLFHGSYWSRRQERRGGAAGFFHRRYFCVFDKRADARAAREPARVAETPARNGRLPGADEALDRSAGVAYAEGLRQYKVHPYPQTNLLRELLAEYVLA